MKERLDHIRKVHFSLLVACLAVLLATTVPSATDYDAALSDATTIQRLFVPTDGADIYAPRERTRRFAAVALSGYQQVNQLLTTTGEISLSSPFFISPLTDLLTPITALPRPDATRYYFELCLPNSTLRRLPRDAVCDRRVYAVNGSVGYFPRDPLGILATPITSLAEFRRYWDALHENRGFALSSGIDLASAAIVRVNQAAAINMRLPHPVVDLELTWLTSDDLRRASQAPNNWASFSVVTTASGDAKLVLDAVIVGFLPVELAAISLDTNVEEVPVGLQAMLISELSQQRRWRPGSFAQSFPEIDELPPSILMAEIDDAVEQLQLLAKERHQIAGKEVSALGVDFPAAAIPLWGGVVIFGVLLYYWLHVRALVRALPGGPLPTDIPWIGLYRDRVSFVVFLCSSAVLPAFVAAFLFMAATGAGGSALAFAVAVAASIGIVLVCGAFVPEALALRASVLIGKEADPVTAGGRL